MNTTTIPLVPGVLTANIYQDTAAKPLWRRLATFNAPWLGWSTESTCDFVVDLPGYIFRFRAGTAWC